MNIVALLLIGFMVGAMFSFSICNWYASSVIREYKNLVPLFKSANKGFFAVFELISYLMNLVVMLEHQLTMNENSKEEDYGNFNQ